MRIGVSSCLLGAEVRYDGSHKREAVILDVLGPHFEYVPVCPELEAGMGVPREAVRLVGGPRAPRMRGVKSRIDHTRRMERFSKARVRALAKLDLSGFLLKAKSPSCGVAHVKLYSEAGRFTGKQTRGLFARHLIAGLPYLPIEEEGRLRDPSVRENFVGRAHCYHRWRNLVTSGLTPRKLAAFHRAHTPLILAHSPEHDRRLDRLVAAARRYTPARLAAAYASLFFEALRNHA